MTLQILKWKKPSKFFLECWMRKSYKTANVFYNTFHRHFKQPNLYTYYKHIEMVDHWPLWQSVKCLEPLSWVTTLDTSFTKFSINSENFVLVNAFVYAFWNIVDALEVWHPIKCPLVLVKLSKLHMVLYFLKYLIIDFYELRHMLRRSFMRKTISNTSLIAPKVLCLITPLIAPWLLPSVKWNVCLLMP